MCSKTQFFNCHKIISRNLPFINENILWRNSFWIIFIQGTEADFKSFFIFLYLLLYENFGSTFYDRLTFSFQIHYCFRWIGGPRLTPNKRLFVVKVRRTCHVYHNLDNLFFTISNVRISLLSTHDFNLSCFQASLSLIHR